MISKQGLLTLLFIIIIIPLGFFTKSYSGPAQDWINNSLGGALYEIFWCLVFYFLFPKSKPFILAIVVLISTCLLEFLQLWHPPFLEEIRRNFIGRTILGNSFNWMDFPYYFAGSLLGFFVLRFISGATDR
jgi:hypothetical protein